MLFPIGSIKNWADLEKLFLAYFFEDDTEVSVSTLLATRKEKKRVHQNVYGKILEYGAMMSQ